MSVAPAAVSLAAVSLAAAQAPLQILPDAVLAVLAAFVAPVLVVSVLVVSVLVVSVLVVSVLVVSVFLLSQIPQYAEPAVVELLNVLVGPAALLVVPVGSQVLPVYAVVACCPYCRLAVVLHLNDQQEALTHHLAALLLPLFEDLCCRPFLI
ncbi:hypothetical protein KJ764_02150 [Patescibacteria group bacterium]|nr:hypothetical protein [Patescibacteria group bacterium]